MFDQNLRLLLHPNLISRTSNPKTEYFLILSSFLTYLKISKDRLKIGRLNTNEPCSFDGHSNEERSAEPEICSKLVGNSWLPVGEVRGNGLVKMIKFALEQKLCFNCLEVGQVAWL